MNEPLFNWLNQRSSGALLHITSLPSGTGIGNMGEAAYKFIDLLSAGHMRYWQVLPMCPTGYGNSPYQSYSSFALNSMLIDWNPFVGYGWITQHDLLPLKVLSHTSADFDAIRGIHPTLYQKAITAGLADEAHKEPFNVFVEANSHWLIDYSAFICLKALNRDKVWYEWKKAHRAYSAELIKDLQKTHGDALKAVQFEQYLLYHQWNQLKQYANERGIQIVGDLPIYVSADSADTWANVELFQYGKRLTPTRLAGVPPDYFNEDGQFWGNPLYDWKAMKTENFAWWMRRLKHSLEQFDVVRLDHFRALEAYWSIPHKAETAKEGKWVKGPGIAFFEAMKQVLPHAKLIVEDLGVITPEVLDLKLDSGFPGLAVLQFAFGGESDNFYLPHNISPNTVICTGTHDNDTSLGWYKQTDDKTRDHLRRYLMVSGDEVSWDLIRAAYRSVANLCIIPFQDFLALDEHARMNVPGLASGNWGWRSSWEQLNQFEGALPYLRELADLYGRN